MSTLDLGKVRLTWKGTWSAASSYAINDVVSLNSGVWICTQAHNAGSGNEFAPGRRDRLSAYGRTLDPDEIITFNVTVQTVGPSNFFFIDGVRTPTITLFPNVRYRFMQQDPSNINNRFALSTTSNGIFGGGSELTSGITYVGTAGVDGSLNVVLPSGLPSTIFYYSAQGTNLGGAIARSNTWRGWQYWDLMTSGFTFKNTWNSLTTYYANDVVEYQGATYIALADSINKQPSSPGNNHYWLTMVNGDRRSDHNAAAHFMNKGPLDWPYPNGNNGYANAFGALKYISRSGRVYHHGPGSWSHGIDQTNQNVSIGQPQEICFNHFEWWNSRDNGGPGRMTTPDSQPPRCIQVEQGNGYAYFLFNNGEVWASGENASGAVGDGTLTSTGLARRVTGLAETKIVKISTGWGSITTNNRHVLALDEYGYVWSWGRNDTGQLGHGHIQDLARAERIPRSYFGGERIVDILAMGNNSGHSYARTSSDQLYAWGNNAIGQLGDTTTTNRWRPVRMLNWDPVANNGILKWQAANVGGAAAFMILDGNRFLWGTGEDSNGNLAQSTATNRTQLTRTAVAPGGSIQDFWALWASDQNGRKITFIRHQNGTTFVCGLGSNASFVNGLTASTTAITTGPQLIPAASNVLNVREVYLDLTYSTEERTVHFLLDNGRTLSQGYNAYGLIGQPERAGVSSNTTDESGTTSYPLTKYMLPGTRSRQYMSGGSPTTANNQIHGSFYLTESGQIYGTGMSRNAVGARNAQFANFITWGQNPGENAAVYMPVSLSWAR
jgi:Regulator of chromosome condensation (RCC1) repeat